MASGSEIELKLELSAGAAKRLVELPWLRAMATAPARSERLVSVYFDTAKQKLRTHGLTLRVRHNGDSRIQTIKSEGEPGRAGFERGEWETEIPGDRPDLELAAGAPLEKLGKRPGRKLKRKLRPVFETEIDRMVMPLECDGAVLELALDRGTIRSGGRRQTVREIEIELKEGDPAGLLSVAGRLAGSLPVAYGVRSKAERGYALCRGEAGRPAHATPIALDASVATGEAFAAIGLSCLKQVLSNREAVAGGEGEGVHQMRVGLRRLRAAISLFDPLLADDAETKSIKRALKWLTDELGPAREYEVLIGEHLRPLRRAEPHGVGLHALERELRARRERALDRARKAVQSDRFRGLGLQAALWLANGAWLRSDDPLARTRRDRPAVDFARDALARRTRRIVKKMERVAELTPRRRHKLRIAVKKLRYASDFLAGPFGARARKSRAKAFAGILKSLQGSLGKLNDIEAHRRIAKSVADPRRPLKRKAETSFAMGLVSGVEHERVAECLASAQKAGRKLAAATPFWH